jgi:hypothetical protein
MRSSKEFDRNFKGVVCGCDTRFFYGLRQAERLMLIDCALRRLEARWTENSVDWLKAYSRLLKQWDVVRPAAEAVLVLFLPLLNDYERLGSENEYTLSIR